MPDVDEDLLDVMVKLQSFVEDDFEVEWNWICLLWQCKVKVVVLL